jgi:membrane protein
MRAVFPVLRKKWQGIVWLLKKVSLPGLEGVAIFEVLRLYVQALQQRNVNDRAAAVSFHFFMGIFPSIIFLFTLIPYAPIPNLQQQILDTVAAALPEGVYKAVKWPLLDIVRNRKAGLLSFTLVVSLWISSNAFHGLLRAFAASVWVSAPQSFWRQRGQALGLTLAFFMLITFFAMMRSVKASWLLELGLPKGFELMWPYLTSLLSLVLLYGFIQWMLQWGATGYARRGFFSAGATAATLFLVLFSKAFSFYLEHFRSFNDVYGALGTIPLFLSWLFLSALALLIGFELNVSIGHARSIKGFNKAS